MNFNALAFSHVYHVLVRLAACSMNSYLFKNCNLAIEILQAIETFL